MLASVCVALCCPHVACTAPLLLRPHPAASMYLPVTFVARGELTVLFSCLHAPDLWPQTLCPAVLSRAPTVARALAIRAKSSSAEGVPVMAAPARYSTALSILHWVQAAGVATCIGTVLISQRTPPEDKERKGQLMHLHKSTGGCLDLTAHEQRRSRPSLLCRTSTCFMCRVCLFVVRCRNGFRDPRPPACEARVQVPGTHFGYIILLHVVCCRLLSSAVVCCRLLSSAVSLSLVPSSVCLALLVR